MRLLRKRNTSLLAWLKLPVVYRHDPVFAAEFGALAAEFCSPRRCFAHYLHVAFGNWCEYLLSREEVSPKKYLYVFPSASRVPLDRALARPSADALRATRGGCAR